MPRGRCWQSVWKAKRARERSCEQERVRDHGQPTGLWDTQQTGDLVQFSLLKGSPLTDHSVPPRMEGCPTQLEHTFVNGYFGQMWYLELLVYWIIEFIAHTFVTLPHSNLMSVIVE